MHLLAKHNSNSTTSVYIRRFTQSTTSIAYTNYRPDPVYKQHNWRRTTVISLCKQALKAPATRTVRFEAPKQHFRGRHALAIDPSQNRTRDHVAPTSAGVARAGNDFEPKRARRPTFLRRRTASASRRPSRGGPLQSVSCPRSCRRTSRLRRRSRSRRRRRGLGSARA